ncbi:flavin-containing monooxygenase [Cumulibacter manganitolerans]|uniref:flavin-containing monooxygenase n=1 Tax=Cumulibacter manganitolerans TaxID=1884992 RepID=UPI001294EE98|nr:NAD(P)/FAD-dependent oxidoreductase [Cumulibacter manganitolerans]
MTTTHAQQRSARPESADLDHEVIIVGAGVCGIYQLYRMRELGIDATILEAAPEVGGTWYWNRYPGARFDSESVTYSYSFSDELLQEWDWKERFSGQPENLRYLQYVVDKFDLRRDIQLGVNVDGMTWREDSHSWAVRTSDGRELTSRFVVLGIGLLSVPTPPSYPGLDTFAGKSSHTFDFSLRPEDWEGKRVGVIGAGATSIQLVPEIAKTAGELHVFIRRPNWIAPLNNSEISPEEMAELKSRYTEIFEACAKTPGGFVHDPDRRPFFEVPREERLALWERLYTEPGFGIWLANFRDTFMNEEANAELSEFMADKIRGRIDDPEVADFLVPKDHGFGVQRVPMETNYLEAFNRDTVHLVNLQKTPIQRITPTGIETTDGEIELDVIIYATGFDAVTGAYERMDIRGVDGLQLKDAWADGPVTYFGLEVPGFPNMLMPTGPQSASASTNFPRGIEYGVDWATDLMKHMWDKGLTREEPTREAAEAWDAHVKELYGFMLMRKAQGWFTGYNSNVAGHEKGTIRYVVYNGGAPKFRRLTTEEADAGYPGLTFG